MNTSETESSKPQESQNNSSTTNVTSDTSKKSNSKIDLNHSQITQVGQVSCSNSSQNNNNPPPPPSSNAKRLVLELIEAVQNTTRSKHNRENIFGLNHNLKERICSMKYRNVGKNGIRLPLLAFSAWNNFALLSDDKADEVLTVAYENGINYFDTGDAFGSGDAEAVLGRVLAHKSWPRSSYVVSTKIFAKSGPTTHLGGGLSRKFIIEAVEASLKRLNMKYLDILIIHKLDAMCPMEEIVRTMSYLINRGLIFYWGTSRFAPMHIAEAFAISRQFNCPPPICEQMEYHMDVRDKMELQMLELFHKAGIGCITWSPISVQNDPGVAFISRRNYQIFQESSHRMGFSNPKFEQLQKLCQSLGCDLSQLSLAWCLQNENVNCILVSASSAPEMLQKIQSIKVRLLIFP